MAATSARRTGFKRNRAPGGFDTARAATKSISIRAGSWPPGADPHLPQLVRRAVAQCAAAGAGRPGPAGQLRTAGRHHRRRRRAVAPLAAARGGRCRAARRLRRAGGATRPHPRARGAGLGARQAGRIHAGRRRRARGGGRGAGWQGVRRIRRLRPALRRVAGRGRHRPLAGARPRAGRRIDQDAAEGCRRYHRRAGARRCWRMLGRAAQGLLRGVGGSPDQAPGEVRGRARSRSRIAASAGGAAAAPGARLPPAPHAPRAPADRRILAIETGARLDRHGRHRARRAHAAERRRAFRLGAAAAGCARAPPADRRVPGHQPAAMAGAARLAAKLRGRGRWRRGPQRVHRRRPQAEHLPLPPRRAAGVHRRAAVHHRGAGRRPAGLRPHAPQRARRAGRRQRRDGPGADRGRLRRLSPAHHRIGRRHGWAGRPAADRAARESAGQRRPACLARQPDRAA